MFIEQAAPQAEGVTQGSEAPQSTSQDSTPESIETGDTHSSEGNTSEPQGDQPKSKEYNFKQMRENLNRLETERKQWLSEKEGLKNATALDQALRTNPKETLRILSQQLGVDLKTLMEEMQPKS